MPGLTPHTGRAMPTIGSQWPDRSSCPIAQFHGLTPVYLSIPLYGPGVRRPSDPRQTGTTKREHAISSQQNTAVCEQHNPGFYVPSVGSWGTFYVGETLTLIRTCERGVDLGHSLCGNTTDWAFRKRDEAPEHSANPSCSPYRLLSALPFLYCRNSLDSAALASSVQKGSGEFRRCVTKRWGAGIIGRYSSLRRGCTWFWTGSCALSRRVMLTCVP